MNFLFDTQPLIFLFFPIPLMLTSLFNCNGEKKVCSWTSYSNYPILSRFIPEKKRAHFWGGLFDVAVNLEWEIKRFFSVACCFWRKPCLSKAIVFWFIDVARNGGWCCCLNLNDLWNNWLSQWIIVKIHFHKTYSHL